MAGAGVAQKIERTPRNIAGSIIGALVVALVLATILFFLVLLLTFAYWKAAVLAEIFAVAAAVVAWKRRMFATWLRYVVVGTTVVVAVALAVLLQSTWVVQAHHDARLSAMVTDLCSVELSGGNVEDCEGSISNTGNGNSCRYLAIAIVRSPMNGGAITSELESKGFGPTDLDLWGDPIEDGQGYLVDGENVRLFLQSSWQNDEGDLRCT